MKLIIEGGSSKTQSVLLNTKGDLIKKANTAGINPVTDPNFKVAVHELINKYIDQELSTVYHYGSGCINSEVNGSLRHEYATNWGLSESDISISDDLTGSAKATCQHDKGIVAICGTGSIAGYYNGQQMVEKLASGGYLMGDEGSGFDIGRRLMIRYVRHQLSKAEQDIISNDTELDPASFITHLYEQANVRKYLASQSLLINKMNQETKMTILNEAFTSMCQNMLVPLYNKHATPIHFIGSVSFYFRDILNDILNKFDILASTYEPTAIKGLVNYHRHE